MSHLSDISIYFFSTYTLLVIFFSFLCGRLIERSLSSSLDKKKILDYNRASMANNKIDLRDFSTNLPRYRPAVLESAKWRAESDTGLLYSIRRERFVKIPKEFVDLVRFLEKKGNV